jgi:hypothetical protein
MNSRNKEKCVQASLPNLYEYKETFESGGVEIISPQGDTEEMHCEDGSCAISMVLARRMKLMRNSKAA